MVLAEAEILATTLIKEHNVNYSFYFDESVSRFGACHYRTKAISLSRHLTEMNDEPTVRNMILHEIAHALCPAKGHGSEWQRMAKTIGCDGNRLYSRAVVKTPDRKWTAICPSCKKSCLYHKRRKLWCKACYIKNGRKLDNMFKFIWTETKGGENI